MDNVQPLALIVEDEPAIMKLLATILHMQGYRTMTAGTAAAAAHHLASARPDLVTLDLNLPGASGTAILRNLRANPDTMDLPVILVSACTQVEPDLAANVQGVVTKPFDLSEFLDVVHRATAASAAVLQVGA